MTHATLQQISVLLKYWTPRRINQLVKEDGFPRIGHGEYDIMASVHWTIDYYRKEIERLKAGGETMREAELRVEKARAGLLEMDLARKRGDLIAIDELIFQLEPVLKAIRERILAIPRKAAPQLQSRETIPEKEELLKQLVYEVLNDLASLQIRARSYPESTQARHSKRSLHSDAAPASHGKRMGRSKKKTQSRK